MNDKNRASIILGVFMAVVLIGGTLLQFFRSGSSPTTTTVVPTATAAPTFPAPPETASLDFSQFYLHPTGIFAIAQPNGFDQATPNTTASVAQVNMVNNTSLSVIDAFVQDPGRAVTTADLSGYFTAELLDSTWDFFSNWTETNRSASDTDLTIDFAVTLNQQQYVARQRAWTDGAWVYSVRVLTPANATDYLRALLDGAAGSMFGFTQFAGTPLNWTAFYDPTSGAIIRTPADWQVTDGGAGRPTTMTGTDGATVRVETHTGTSVASAEDASNLLLATRPNAVIASTTEITREGSATAVALTGYELTYTTTTADGDTQSGIASFLNSPTGDLLVAVLRAPFAGLEQSSAEATPDPSVSVRAADYQLIMTTFGALPPMSLSSTVLPATATPAPTTAPTAEATVEMTAEATDAATDMMEATAEVTPEATAAQ